MEQNFILIEYEMLRKKMDECIAEFRALERYAILASAAVYSFGFSTDQNEYKGLIFLIPLLIAVLCAFRAWAMRRYINLIGRYLLQVEGALGLGQTVGYEHYLASQGVKTENIAATVIWGSLILFNAFIWWFIS